MGPWFSGKKIRKASKVQLRTVKSVKCNRSVNQLVRDIKKKHEIKPIYLKAERLEAQKIIKRSWHFGRFDLLQRMRIYSYRQERQIVTKYRLSDQKIKK